MNEAPESTTGTSDPLGDPAAMAGTSVANDGVVAVVL